MKPLTLGTYRIGHENVRVIADPAMSGGRCDVCPDSGAVGEITVGLDVEDWESVVDTLLHEVFEYLCIRYGYRYSPNTKTGDDMSNFLFLFDHIQFTQVCAKAAQAISPALPKLAAAYRKCKKH